MFSTINKKLFRYIFNASYLGAPGWEIGRPQPEIIALERRNEIQGSILDLGCGTGENTIFLAQTHAEVIGIDYSPRAIKLARKKAEARGSKAQFQVMDAFDIMSLNRSFTTIIDSTLFPNIAKNDRSDYVKTIRDVLSPEGTFLLLTFSDKTSNRTPPYRMTKEEVTTVFTNGWKINYIREGYIALEKELRQVPAWTVSASSI